MFQHKLRYVFILLLSGYSFLNIYFTIGTTFFDVSISPLTLLFVMSLQVLGVWELNRMADNLINKIGRTRRLPLHSLVILFLTSLLVVASVTFVTLFLMDLIADTGGLNFENFKLLLAFGFRVNLFLHCINAVVFFMTRYRETKVEAEKLRKDTIEAQFEALRAQINPHFLFNCLNVLSSLVFKDADTSARFIGQLSNVYRYLLFSQEKKVTQLSEEIEFLKSYMFLLKIRFGDNVKFNVDLPRLSEYYVAPAALQMLIENAIKHNVVSAKHPLEVNVVRVGNKIEISNSLNEKVVKEESAKTGLRNIQDRYKFLSEIPVEIEKTNGWFKVRIPLLTVGNL